MMYTRITDLPSTFAEVTTPELKALSTVWLERKSDLGHHEAAYQEFIKKLQREWAIETGLIEGLYHWERGVTEVLIEQGIDSALIAHRGGLQRDKAEDAKRLIDDQLAIVEGLFAFVTDEQPLTEHFIRAMHAQFTAHQASIEAETPDGRRIQVPLLRGAYKKLSNNPRRRNGDIHEYCPPEIVQEEMTRLVHWYHQAAEDMPPEVLSAWLHHRFTAIHPFQDGNGRVARALASLVFLKKGLFPLVIRDAERTQYIEALEKADAGDLAPLVTLFAKCQRDSLLKALGLEQQVQQAGYVEESISSAVQLLRDRIAVHTAQLQKVYSIADQLLEITQRRLAGIQNVLQRELATVQDTYSARSDFSRNDEEKNYYFYHQIVDIARQCNYFAHLGRYKAWGRLSIRTEERFEFVISLHGYGQGVHGIMVASAFTVQRIPREEGGTAPVNTRPAMTDLFQFNYVEEPDSTIQRFQGWLESVTAIALAAWRRTLHP